MTASGSVNGVFPATHATAPVSPDKEAVVLAETGESRSYGELDRASSRLARCFRAFSLDEGDHVALLTDNALEAVEVYWAAIRSGLYITAVNSHLATDEVRYIVEDCSAKVLIASAACAKIAESLIENTPGVLLRLAFGGPVGGHLDYETTLAAFSAEPFPDGPAGTDMLYSSGTTGRPKGIETALPRKPVSEVGNSFVRTLAHPYRLDSNTVYLSPAPIYHASPLRFVGAVNCVGGTAVIMSKFDAEAALAMVERYRVTHSQWVPTHFVRMLKLPPEVRSRYDVSSMKMAAHAAAPCPVEVKQAMMDWWGPVLYEGYASTEGQGATFIGPAEWLAKPGSVGRAVVGKIRICDDDGNEVPTGVDGLVYFERSRPSFEYRGDAQKTNGARHPRHPNWSTSEDIGHVDEDGYLYLTDRKSFMIISGGVNIYPRETEDILALHPSVADAAVIGVPDAEMGESVKAVVQLVDPAQAGPEIADELIAYVRSRIAHYKAPRSVDFVDHLPRTETGKILKRELQEAFRPTAGSAH